MPCTPPWNVYTLAARGKLVLSDFDLVDLLDDELSVLDRRSELERALLRVQSGISVWDDPADSTTLSNFDEDLEYLPSAAWYDTFLVHWRASHKNAAKLPLVLTELNPIPDVFTPGHLTLMGFRHIRWDEYVFLDERIRIFAYLMLEPPRLCGSAESYRRLLHRPPCRAQ